MKELILKVLMALGTIVVCFQIIRTVTTKMTEEARRDHWKILAVMKGILLGTALALIVITAIGIKSM